MAYTMFREMKPFSQLLFTAFLVMAVFLVLEVLATVIAIPVFGLQHVMGLMSGLDMSDPVTIGMLKYFQVNQDIGLFIVPSLLAAWLLFGNPRKSLHLDRPLNFMPAILVVLLIVVINPFINFIGAINSEMHLPQWLNGLETWMRNSEDAAGKLTDAFLKVNSLGGMFFNLFMVAVLAALGEELLFRGVVQKILTEWTGNHHWGIWIAAALFSALHMQFFGFVPRMLLGALFGYLLVWSGSLWLPILAHFINNAGAVIALYLIDKGALQPSVEDFGAGIGYWYYALPSILIGLMIFLTIKFAYNVQQKGTA